MFTDEEKKKRAKESWRRAYERRKKVKANLRNGLTLTGNEKPIKEYKPRWNQRAHHTEYMRKYRPLHREHLRAYMRERYWKMKAEKEKHGST